jgi:hypothetical protein
MGWELSLAGVMWDVDQRRGCWTAAAFVCSAAAVSVKAAATAAAVVVVSVWLCSGKQCGGGGSVISACIMAASLPTPSWQTCSQLLSHD